MNIESCGILTAPRSPVPTRRSILQPISPASVANIRVRRTNHESTLLHSPARAGHSTRMKQIFAESRRDYAPNAEPNLYPQLPNVSRKAVPPSGSEIAHTPTKQDERLCCLNTMSAGTTRYASVSQSNMNVVQPDASLHSSEAWSNDSSYIITESRERQSASFNLTVDQIQGWLLDIPDSHVSALRPLESLFPEDEHPLTLHADDDSLSDRNLDEFDDDDASIISWTCADPFSCRDVEHHIVSTTGVNPFAGLSGVHARAVSNKDDSCPLVQPKLSTPSRGQFREPSSTEIISNEVLLRDGGIELSPLSPNVCIERGPSRYHGTPRSPHKRDISTPTRRRFDIHEGKDMSKENLA